MKNELRIPIRATGSAFLFAFMSITAFAQRPTPAPAQTKSVLVIGAVVHVGNGTVIDDGAVGFRNGVIDFVGHSYGTKAAYDTTIRVEGGHIYPGFILADNTLGLHEIDLVRATNDQDETGEMEPEVRALPAFNTDSRIIPTVRSNGVLLVQSTPRGGTFSGTSSVMQLDAWNWADAVVRADDGVHIIWPRTYTQEGWWAERGDTEKGKADEHQERLNGIKDMLLRAKANAAVRKPDKPDVRTGALRGLFDGSTTLYVHADRAKEIQEAVLMAHGLEVKHVVIVGGYDAWRVSDLLRDKKVDVILRRIHSLPMRDDDDIDMPERLPALLAKKGVRFCLSYTGEMERMGARNLAFTAGTVRANGLSNEEALRSITLDAAAILGLDKRYGSLEMGKSATLFISTGDALDMRTNNVVQAFIDGRRISLDDHQKQLYRQYKSRYAVP